ncbi:urea ABC transporter ATP-binding protein UrtD [Effusibacillus lacus]|uniref:ABC transporter ATP-binding protein n=1 Tax=Effusibacillus lacus TaxID=1348429 RepID=A0A292YLK3_9BACL|nr:urea ABC transporter ATP-binding protein UrtD [Effusibacillus lacus]TCS70929.1 urea transport system ATP-binding protein [Effusibacillus lacus]GAX90036.1 ABC transporter ATP-binding protein [Effusibacillus lacus]
MPSVLETQGLTVEFNGFKAVSDLNFSLEKGELRVILGPNGAGKTTFMDLITGKTKPTSGNVLLNGHNITGLEPYQISKLGVGRKFQGPNVFDNMTVYENIEVSMKGYYQVFKALFYRKNQEIRDKIHEILQRIDLLEKAHHVAVNLSHGERQWLEIGMLLAQDPELIILDEPTAGMTAEETYKTGVLIETLFKDRSIIVVEHDMSFVRQIARKVTVLHQGRLLAEGSLAEIEQNTKVQEVYLREGVHA